MRSFYAVDPGVNYFAWAFYGNERIAQCGLFRGRAYEWARHYSVSGFSLVIEDQAILPGKRFHADIIDLAQAAGGVANQFPEDRVTWAPLLQFPKPKKGQQSIPEQRCRKYLTKEELALFLAHGKTELEHLWDAGYFALKYAGRLTPGS